VWQRFDTVIPNVTGTLSLGDYLLGEDAAADGVEVAEFRGSLGVLENQPTAELERLFTETLDCCAHRLDAWITSVPSRRLEQMREREPLGVHLGAYGWVEDLRPAPPQGLRRIPMPDGTTVQAQSNSGGYIHAPSMSHAAAAAVLRNAWMTRSGDQQDRYAVDLSSGRVRTAVRLLDAVREGQALGAVLGYQFERGLHEGHRPVELDKYIDVFRRLFPLVANKIADSGLPAETIAARNVVDGLRLRTAFRENLIPFGSSGLPGTLPDGSFPPDRIAIEDELRHLDETVDSVADLLLAEAVYQIVKGNMAASAASLDALGEAARPPSPEVARQPRGGTGLTHRMVLVLGGEPLVPGTWAGVASTPRAEAEPWLDGWAGILLGDPGTVLARASYRDPQPADAEHRTEMVVSLADLQLRPADVLAAVKGVSANEGASDLDRRISWVVLGEAPAQTDVRIDYTADPAWDRATVRTFPELLEMARAVNAVIGGSRPLQPGDLLPPERIAEAQDADLMPAEMAARAAATLNRFEADREQLAGAIAEIEATPENSAPDLSALRQALLRVSLFGIPGTVPVTRKGSSPELRAEILLAARSALEQMQRRGLAALAEPEPAERLRTLFGRDLTVLPRFRPVAATELADALAHGPALTGGPDAVRTWFRQAAPVHAALRRWRTMGIYHKAANEQDLALDVAQLPHTAGARWVGLPFGSENERPPSGRLSLVMHRAAAPEASAPWVGLEVHEWTEIIPSKSEQRAVAFHYDDPGGEAPQAVLLAVPPLRDGVWDAGTVLDILQETFDLAKIRSVDGDLLGILGQLLPAIYIAENPSDDTIGVDLSDMQVAEPRIVGR
jgi:hypothetical protein